RRMPTRAHLGVTEFAHAPRFDLAAKLRGHRLHAVADAEHRNAEVPDGGWRARCLALRDARRSARKQDAACAERTHEVVADVPRVNLAIDVRFPEPARNQLRVLRAEIQDQDLRVRGRRHYVIPPRLRLRRGAAPQGEQCAPWDGLAALMTTRLDSSALP